MADLLGGIALKQYLKIIIALVLACILIVALSWEKIQSRLTADQSGWAFSKGAYFRLDVNGNPLTGWFEENGTTYYLDPRYGGARASGLTKVDNCYYFFSEDGLMQTGWQSDRNNLYYMGSDGKAVQGWQTFNNNRYHFGDDYIAAVGHVEIDSKYYFFDENGVMLTGWQETPDGIYYLNNDGTAWMGWMDSEDGFRFFDETGLMATGWLDFDGSSFYMEDNGYITTGWATLEERISEEEIERLQEKAKKEGKKFVMDEPREVLYYFREDGVMATGWQKIDQKDHYFIQANQKAYNGRFLTAGMAARGRVTTPQGTLYFAHNGELIPMMDKWNSFNSIYEPNLYDEGYNGVKLIQECADALRQMLDDAHAAKQYPVLRQGYLPQNTSKSLYTQALKNAKGDADEVLKTLSPPEMDEHRLGLTADLTPDSSAKYDASVIEKTPAIQWLMENCWKYGFILRYPKGDEVITGIPYRPWQYRYVGVEIATQMHELDMCLEEYIDYLTGLETKSDEIMMYCAGRRGAQSE